MPERLTKKIEVEGDGSKIQEQVRRFQELKFGEFKITKGILEKFGLSDNCKGCDAAASGTDARRHTDVGRRRLEQLIREDEVLRVRPDLRDVRLSRDAECENTQKRPEEWKVDELLMGEAEAAGGKVAGVYLLVNEDNIFGAETFEAETSDANREDAADKERDEGRRKMASEREKRNQDNKRRRLQLLATEKKLLDKFPEGCLHGPSRHDLNRILSALEFGPTTKEGCTIDASGILNAVQGSDESPHDGDAEMERWSMMCEGIEFWDDVDDWKPLNWELAVQARKVETEVFKMGVHKKVPRDVAEKMGCKVITTNWVDTNKSDTSWPNYRSMLVGREVKYDTRLDLFSATPPLETLKFLCSMCAR